MRDECDEVRRLRAAAWDIERSIDSLSDQLMTLRDLPPRMFLDEDQPLTGEEQKVRMVAECAGDLAERFKRHGEVTRMLKERGMQEGGF